MYTVWFNRSEQRRSIRPFGSKRVAGDVQLDTASDLHRAIAVANMGLFRNVPADERDMLTYRKAGQ